MAKRHEIPISATIPGMDEGIRAFIRKVIRTALAAEGIAFPCEVDVLLTSDAKIQEINRAQRGVDSPTDVLSFPAFDLESGEPHALKGTGEAYALEDTGEAYALKDTGEAYALEDIGEAYALEDAGEAPPLLADMADPGSGRVPLGDMVISMDRVAAQAKEYGHSNRRELAYLVTHSVLHLLGYDHLDEGPQKAQMRAREEAILAELDLKR